MRYSTLPIVHQIGGLQDSVQPFNPVTGEGTGFGSTIFWLLYDARNQEALRLYAEPVAWTKSCKASYVYKILVGKQESRISKYV